MSNDVFQTATWQDVAPLLQRWQMALAPAPDRSWDVLAGWPRGGGLPRLDTRAVPWAQLPAAIAALAARCEAQAQGEGGR